MALFELEKLEPWLQTGTLVSWQNFYIQKKKHVKQPNMSNVPLCSPRARTRFSSRTRQKGAPPPPRRMKAPMPPWKGRSLSSTRIRRTVGVNGSTVLPRTKASPNRPTTLPRNPPTEMVRDSLIHHGRTAQAESGP